MRATDGRIKRMRVARVIGGVFGNPDLRRLELAFAAFNAAQWGTWVAMLVYAYRHGGAMTAGFVAVVQLVPAALCSPAAASFADRKRPPAATGALLAVGSPGLVFAVMSACALAAALAVLPVDGPRPVVVGGGAGAL